MKGRKQKISQDTCLQKDRAVPEGYAGGQTFMWITENNLTGVESGEYGMLEFILSPANMNAAYKQVLRNKGAGGVDQMRVESLKEYLIVHKEVLLRSIQEGNYRPNPVRRVEIPKEPGRTRALGIPTVVDRVIQQAIAQVVSPVFERQFSTYSYGFRPKRSAHQALRQCQQYITDGYVYAVDLDLEKFFDTVSHSKLIEVLSRTIKDSRVISLVHKYLKAGIARTNGVEQTKEGVPQGGPLSPLLSNIMLHELDRELENRGHRFVRYADDLLVLCRSERTACRVSQSLRRYIEGKLFLKVNEQKSRVTYINEVKFLGYSFYKTKGKGSLRVAPQSVERMKTRIRELTSRKIGWGYAKRKEELRQFITGWVNFFGLAQMKHLLKEIDGWYRRRLRKLIWKNWQRVRTRFEKLCNYGVDSYQAKLCANSRAGAWRTSASRILENGLRNETLRGEGYYFFSEHYRRLSA